MSVIIDLKHSLGLYKDINILDSDNIPDVETSWHINFEDLELNEILGSGEFGEVFAGSYFGTDVAIKKMNVKTMGRENMTKYLKRELECSKFSHPHLVAFIGVCEEENNEYIYLVTERLQCSLRDVLRNSELEGSDLLWIQRNSFALDAAKALAFLHAKRIIHRDIKSKNLLVDENMKVKVCDFGFARTYSKEKRRMTICGTDEWMAPEVILEEPYNELADVFSYGIVLLEIITRKKVKTHFQRYPQTFFALDMIEAAKYIPLDCPKKLRDLVFQCCDTDPDKRPTFRTIIEILNVIRAELQLKPLNTLEKKQDDARRALLSPRRSNSVLHINRVSELRNSKPRCSFTDLNELALSFDNELQVEELLLKRFDPSIRKGSWIVIGYYDENVLGIQADGDGGVEELVDILANDEVQYCLLRLLVEEDGIEKLRDVFIYWTGPNVPMVTRGKKKIHLGSVQKVLCPFHADLLAYNRDLLTEDIIKERSHPLSGSHVIE